MLRGVGLVGFMQDFVSSFLLVFWLLQFFVQTLDIKISSFFFLKKANLKTKPKKHQ